MTPREKAEELTEKFNNINNAIFRLLRKPVINSISKQCALIAVDEILHEIIYKNPSPSALSRINYWEEVKQEIEKL